ncbi:MAG: hypothetical protein GTN76_12130 [Candidatus Aenigmarchaeota archaeon]|nr:hypothetical protein [Candidatus Aenigmarchaeota archaeon]
MEKMGIESDFCAYHVLHWVLMDSGMQSKFYLEPDKERDKSRIYGDKINREKIKGNLKRYEDVLYEKIRKILCS